MIKQGHMLCHFLDVDMRGSGILIQVEDYNILIDLAYETGTQKIIDYLNRRGIAKLDVVVITHPHRDHMAGQGAGGLQIFLDSFEVGEVWSNGVPLPVWYDGTSLSPYGPDSVADYDSYLRTIYPEGYTVGGEYDYPGIVGIGEPVVSYVEPRMGDIFNFGELEIKIIYPTIPHKIIDTNATSIVMQLNYKGKKIMLPGDSNHANESVILENLTSNELKSDVLYLGHHGYSGSTSVEWLDAVSPSMAVVQRRNQTIPVVIGNLSVRDIPLYDMYFGEPFENPNKDVFVDYVFVVSEEDIRIVTIDEYESEPIDEKITDMLVNKNGLSEVRDILVKQNGVLRVVANILKK